MLQEVESLAACEYFLGYGQLSVALLRLPGILGLGWSFVLSPGDLDRLWMRKAAGLTF